MRVICKQDPAPLEPSEGVAFSLFQRPQQSGIGRVATNMREDILRAGVEPSLRAWDFLAIALSISAADHSCQRKASPDGWTRIIRLEVAVTDPKFWKTQIPALEATLQFLTGDIWYLSFVGGGVRPPRRLRRTDRRLNGDCVCLLSGGVDSLVGAIDAVSAGKRPVLVSQKSQGDSERQRKFAMAVGESLSHLQLTHAIKPPGKAERSQRARSMIFLAYGVLAASVLPQHRRGQVVELIVPENGFISLNVPLTPFRLGSLSTRTTHPYFIQQIQNILDSSGFHVKLSNRYQFKTKGEVPVECSDQHLLQQLVFETTSCGRFARFNYNHCGRCVPCLIRRAAFLRWGMGDETKYLFKDLTLPGSQHRDFDDVRSVVFATLRVAQSGLEDWAGAALNHVQLGDITPFVALVERGIAEVQAFLDESGVL